MWYINTPTTQIVLQDLDVRAEDSGAGLPAVSSPRTLVLRCSSKQRRVQLQRTRLAIANGMPPGTAVEVRYQNVTDTRTLALRAMFMPKPGDVDPSADTITLCFEARDRLWSWPLDDDPVPVPLAVQASIANANYLLQRTPVSGWRALGSGMNNNVTALAMGLDGSLYAGGWFTSPAGRVARWNRSSWSALGTGCNNDVNALAVGLDGSLYVGGAFTSPGSRVARWHGSAWSALGSGLGGTVYALAVGPDGSLYVGGSFTTAGGVSVSNIARWNGTSWSALGAGVGGVVFALAVGRDGTLYAAGDFGAPGLHIARWNGSSWSALGSGLNDLAFALAVGPDGSLYAGGVFTQAGGVPASRIARWNGTSWSALGSGTNADVSALAVGGDGTVYASGSFTQAGGLTSSDRIARWTGAVWLPIDVDVPGTSEIKALHIARDGTLSVGYQAAGAATAVGLTTVNNIGSAAAPVRLVLRGPGRCYELVNFTTVQSIYFNLALVANEVVTVDLTPGTLACTSTVRGNLIGALVPGSALATFRLQPGANAIGCYMTGSTHPMPAELHYWPRYWSLDSVTSDE